MMTTAGLVVPLTRQLVGGRSGGGGTPVEGVPGGTGGEDSAIEVHNIFIQL